VQGATTPAAVTACNGANVQCVGAALGVSIPNPAAAVTCAQNATTCVLDARSPADLTKCTDDLAACAKELDPTSPVNCDIAFTQCVAKNPFNLFQCADTARKCHLGQ
jgi:hypothetical protein